MLYHLPSDDDQDDDHIPRSKGSLPFVFGFLAGSICVGLFAAALTTEPQRFDLRFQEELITAHARIEKLEGELEYLTRRSLGAEKKLATCVCPQDLEESR